MKRLFLLLAFVAMGLQLSAQEVEHYKAIVKELSSKKYHGRGYAEDGANKAGRWIAKEFDRVGADEVVCQPFKLDINTFPGKKTYYPGAHDNASGTAAIITLAAYYAENKPDYDIYFIAFAGEDANLRGSEWFAQHPTVPLEQIRYLINLDMIADNNPALYSEVSDQGMAGYALFNEINTQEGYFAALDKADLADNSDHYPFAVRGVPCIFFMNEGGDAFVYYHTIYDTAENFLSESYYPTFRLLVDFVKKY